MSTETVETVAGRMREGVLELDPSEILLPDETNVRPYSAAHPNDNEIEKLSRLAQSIAEEGQIQPVVVVRNLIAGGPEYSLVAGRRRVAAIKMHNLSADEPIKVRAVVSHIKADKQRVPHMFRQAAHENLQRSNINAMDFALNIRSTREKFGPAGKGAKGTQKLAEFFKVSPATITQHEKLLDLDVELQAKVAEGTLSNDAAFALMKVEKDKRPEVMEAAERIKKNSELVIEAAGEGVDVSVIEVDVTAPDGVYRGPAEPEIPAPAKKKRKAKASKAVGAKHVREAVRQVTGASTKRTRTEILEFFSAQLGPTNGHPNGSIHMFCEGIAEWANGGMGDKKLTNLWDSMVEKSDRGTASKPAPKLESKGLSGSRKGAAGKPAPKKSTKKAKKK